MNISKMKFLVVDDDPGARKTVIEYLNAAGCAMIVECNNGAEGLDMLQKHAIDFVICDWEMPGLDGLELVKKIRLNPKLKNIPFMMITSPISNEGLKVTDAAESGVDAYLIKPFRSRILIEKISEVLTERSEKIKTAVVLVDDDDSVRTFVAEVLTDMGFNPIHQFNKASLAYPYLEKNFQDVALIISDWEMPEMTGIEFLHKVRINRQLADMPFIIITSQTSIEQMKVRKAIDADVDSYLMKPFKVEALQTKVKLVLTKTKISGAVAKALESAALAVKDADWNDAEKSYKHVRALDSNNVDALLGLATVELQRDSVKRYDEAIKYIKKAIEINPRYDIPYIELALVYESSMSIEKAIVTLQEALTKCFPLDRVHYQLGRVFIHRGKTDDGIKNLKKAIELNPKLAPAQNLLDETLKTKDVKIKKKR